MTELLLRILSPGLGPVNICSCHTTYEVKSMNIIFEGLLARARYYEQFEQFHRSVQLVDYREAETCQTTEA